MKILVTGSSGMLGSAICREFKGKYELAGLDVKGPADGVSSPEIFRIADLKDIPEVSEVIFGELPDVIIHAAAWTDVDGCEKDPVSAREANFENTGRLIDAFSQEKQPLFIFISTDYVFDGKKNDPYEEEDQIGPLSVYGQSKAAAEELIRDRLTRYAIVRTSWLYGRHGKNFVDAVLRKAEDTGSLEVVDDQMSSPTFTRDLAGGLMRLLEKGDFNNGTTLHMSNSGHCSWFEFAGEILRIKGLDEKVGLKPISSVELGRAAARPAYSVLDNGRSEKIIGYKMRSWKDALKEYLSECL